jgi:hypothetical protein
MTRRTTILGKMPIIHRRNTRRRSNLWVVLRWILGLSLVAALGAFGWLSLKGFNALDKRPQRLVTAVNH